MVAYGVLLIGIGPLHFSLTAMQEPGPLETRTANLAKTLCHSLGQALWRAVLVKSDGRTPSDSSSQIDGLANSHADPQIAAGREPRTMGLNLWSSVTL